MSFKSRKGREVEEVAKVGDPTGVNTIVVMIKEKK